jgi:hypothetical protein
MYLYLIIGAVLVFVYQGFLLFGKRIKAFLQVEIGLKGIDLVGLCGCIDGK